MASDPSCEELYNNTRSDGQFIISQLKISKKDLSQLLNSSITKALSTKKQKSIEKNSSSLTLYLQNSDLPLPNFSPTIDFDDMMGLIGEIVSELYHKQCEKQDPLYVKWMETGTSKSQGLDLVFHSNERLFSIECKHPHESLANSDNDKSKIILQTFVKGLKKHDDKRTVEFMVRLYKRYLIQKRFLEGSGMDTKELDKKMDLVNNLLKKNDIVEEINLIADKLYEQNVDKNNLDSNLDLSKFSLVSKSIGVLLLLIENLHEISKEVDSNHGA